MFRDQGLGLQDLESGVRCFRASAGGSLPYSKLSKFTTGPVHDHEAPYVQDSLQGFPTWVWMDLSISWGSQ